LNPPRKPEKTELARGGGCRGGSEKATAIEVGRL